MGAVRVREARDRLKRAGVLVRGRAVRRLPAAGELAGAVPQGRRVGAGRQPARGRRRRSISDRQGPLRRGPLRSGDNRRIAARGEAEAALLRRDPRVDREVT